MQINGSDNTNLTKQTNSKSINRRCLSESINKQIHETLEIRVDHVNQDWKENQTLKTKTKEFPRHFQSKNK